MGILKRLKSWPSRLTHTDTPLYTVINHHMILLQPCQYQNSLFTFPHKHLHCKSTHPKFKISDETRGKSCNTHMVKLMQYDYITYDLLSCEVPQLFSEHILVHDENRNMVVWHVRWIWCSLHNFQMHCCSTFCNVNLNNFTGKEDKRKLHRTLNVNVCKWRL